MTELFNLIDRDAGKFSFRITCFLLELYCDDLQDLLAENKKGEKLVSLAIIFLRPAAQAPVQGRHSAALHGVPYVPVRVSLPRCCVCVCVCVQYVFGDVPAPELALPCVFRPSPSRAPPPPPPPPPA